MEDLKLTVTTETGGAGECEDMGGDLNHVFRVAVRVRVDFESRSSGSASNRKVASPTQCVSQQPVSSFSLPVAVDREGETCTIPDHSSDGGCVAIGSECGESGVWSGEEEGFQGDDEGLVVYFIVKMAPMHVLVSFI